jgi:uncharacterized OB-fold protein
MAKKVKKLPCPSCGRGMRPRWRWCPVCGQKSHVVPAEPARAVKSATVTPLRRPGHWLEVVSVSDPDPVRREAAARFLEPPPAVGVSLPGPGHAMGGLPWPRGGAA